MTCDFLQSLEIGSESNDDAALDGWLNVPENAAELVGTGSPGTIPRRKSVPNKCASTPGWICWTAKA